MHRIVSRTVAVAAVAIFAGSLSQAAHAASSAFTYQGRLNVSGSAAHGSYDMQFRLFPVPSGGAQIGVTVALNNEPVEDGLFSTDLDFGPGVFDGAARYLEIAIRPGTSSDPFTVLAPRQEIRPTPYAIHAQRADQAAALGNGLAYVDNPSRLIYLNDSALVTLDDLGRLRVAQGVLDGGESGLVTWGPGGTLNLDLTAPLENLETGYVGVADSRGAVQSAASIFDNGAGGFLTWGPEDSLNVSIGALDAGPDHGYIGVADERGIIQGDLYVNESGEGVVTLWGFNDSLNVDISSASDDPDLGFVGVADANSDYQAAMGIYDTGEGAFYTAGPNGSFNVDISSMTNRPNHGFVGVADDDGILQAGVYVDDDGDGIVFGDFKSFVVDHPSRAGEKIVYVSLEGPEAGIYERGTARLAEGRAVIALPEHFTALADPRSISVQLTPGSFDSLGVGYQRIDDAHIEIRELNGGKGEYDVSYLVQARRAGKEIPTVMTQAQFEQRFTRAERKPQLAGRQSAKTRPALPDTATMKRTPSRRISEQ